MFRKIINSLDEVPPHLVRIAKAALSVGMELSTWQVREEIVLYANGSFFSPDTHDTHALSLVHTAVERGMKHRDGTYRKYHIDTRHHVDYVHVSIGGVGQHTRDRIANRHRALRLAIVDAFEAHYDQRIAEIVR